MPVLRCEAAFVSVQRSDARNAVEGHVAWGILVDRDRVAAPGPLDWLDEVPRVEVLLASPRPNRAGFVERIAVERAEKFGLQRAEGSAIVLLQLAYPAQHREIHTTLVTAEALSAGVDAHDGDVWEAFVHLDVVPGDLRNRPREDLNPVVNWEEHRRQSLVHSQLSPTSVGINICCWLCFCTNCHGCRER